MDPHTSLGIAQIVFYAPMVPLAVHLMTRNGRIRPRMAWWPLIPFTLMRFTGGPVIIAPEKHPGDTSLLIAAIILLNVGVVPLIVADLGLTRIILMDNYSRSPHSNRVAGLLAAGGALDSQDADSSLSIGHALTLAGYIVFAVELVTLTAMQLYFSTKRDEFLASSRRVLCGSLLASPLIMVRTVYGILEVVFVNSRGTLWNPVYGSAVAFGLMVLLAEYIALCAYLYTGYSIALGRGLAAREAAEEAAKA